MTISPLNRSLVAVIDILITTGVCNARGLNLMKLPKNPRGSNGFPVGLLVGCVVGCVDGCIEGCEEGCLDGCIEG